MIATADPVRTVDFLPAPVPESSICPGSLVVFSTP
jgi:hypothetical protein